MKRKLINANKKRSTLLPTPTKDLIGGMPTKRRSPESVKHKKKNNGEEEYHFLKMDEIPYISRDDPTMMLNLTKAVTNTYNSIIFPPEEQDIKEFISEDSVKEFVNIFAFPLFWFYEFTLFIPKEKEKIQEYKKIIGKEWTLFLFSLYNDSNIKKSIIYGFIECFPYFLTQLLQDLFIMMSEGNPIPAKDDFRYKLCDLLVKMFTNIDYIDALTTVKLSKYFRNPPPADIPPEVLNPPKDPNEIPSIMLPKEDLTTLTPPEHSVPPKVIKFQPTSLTPLVQVGTKRDIMPYTKKTKIEITTPQNGQADLETNFPELLPNPNTEQSLTATVDTYQPMNETRSLLHRAQRPHIVEDYYAKKSKFLKNNHERFQKFDHIQDDLTMHLWQIEICSPETLKEFDKNLQRLLNERKFDETPDFSEDDKVLHEFAKQRLAGKYWKTHPKANRFYQDRKAKANPNIFDPYYKEKNGLFRHGAVPNVTIKEPLPDVFLTGPIVKPKREKSSPKASNKNKLKSIGSRISVAEYKPYKKREERIDIDKLEREWRENNEKIGTALLNFRIKHTELSLDLSDMIKEGEKKLRMQQTTQESKEEQKVPPKQTELERYLASLVQNYETFQEIYTDLESFNEMIKGGKTPKIRPI